MKILLAVVVLLILVIAYNMYTSASGTISGITLDQTGFVLTVAYTMTKQPTASPSWTGRKFSIVTASFGGATITGTIASATTASFITNKITAPTAALTGTWAAPASGSDTFKISGKLW